MAEMDMEDILRDGLEIIGGTPVPDVEVIQYGSLSMSVAPKANSLMADQLFSPAFCLAERIERGLVDVQARNVIEVGAGCALPSMLLATLEKPPKLLAITDHPSSDIFGNLRHNVDRNRPVFNPRCEVHCVGYEWTADPRPLLELSPATTLGFDDIIMSDLLHFDTPDILITTINDLVKKSSSSRIYVAAGKYTKPSVCSRFVQKAQDAGIIFEEIVPSSEEGWLGLLTVKSYSKEDLASRKHGSRLWIGQFA